MAFQSAAGRQKAASQHQQHQQHHSNRQSNLRFSSPNTASMMTQFVVELKSKNEDVRIKAARELHHYVMLPDSNYSLVKYVSLIFVSEHRYFIVGRWRCSCLMLSPRILQGVDSMQFIRSQRNSGRFQWRN